MPCKLLDHHKSHKGAGKISTQLRQLIPHEILAYFGMEIHQPAYSNIH